MQKTPNKLKETINNDEQDKKIPKKLFPAGKVKTDDYKYYSVSSEKLITKTEFELRTPEKTSQSNSANHLTESNLSSNKTSEENITTDNRDLKSGRIFGDVEDGMISTAEQARLLIAANKTPSKCLNKTPVKENTPSGKRSVENSPGTPGKYKRVELITLASPKAKRIKQI